MRCYGRFFTTNKRRADTTKKTLQQVFWLVHLKKIREVFSLLR